MGIKNNGAPEVFCKKIWKDIFNVFPQKGGNGLVTNLNTFSNSVNWFLNIDNKDHYHRAYETSTVWRFRVNEENINARVVFKDKVNLCGVQFKTGQKNPFQTRR
jgi:hypothetical protein